MLFRLEFPIFRPPSTIFVRDLLCTLDVTENSEFPVMQRLGILTKKGTHCLKWFGLIPQNRSCGKTRLIATLWLLLMLVENPDFFLFFFC